MNSEDDSRSVEMDRYGYRIKQCAICPRAYGKKWRYHWKTQHPGEEPRELTDGEYPKIGNFNIRDKRFKKGFRPDSGAEFQRALFEERSVVTERPVQYTEKFSSLFEPVPSLTLSDSLEERTYKTPNQYKSRMEDLNI